MAFSGNAKDGLRATARYRDRASIFSRADFLLSVRAENRCDVRGRIRK